MKTQAAERLFVQTCEDVRSRVEKCTCYDLLILSSLVRKLLLDSTPLYVLANKRTKVQIRFPYEEEPIGDSPNGITVRGFLQAKKGSIGKFLRTECVSIPREVYTACEIVIDKFLQMECVSMSREVYTVRQIINAAAHKHGGVHVDLKVTERERILSEWNFEEHGVILMGGGPENPMLFLLHQIGLATLESLDLLYLKLGGKSLNA